MARAPAKATENRTLLIVGTDLFIGVFFPVAGVDLLGLICFNEVIRGILIDYLGLESSISEHLQGTQELFESFFKNRAIRHSRLGSGFKIFGDAKHVI